MYFEPKNFETQEIINFFLKKNPDPDPRTKITRTQIQEHKPKTQNTNPKHRRQEHMPRKF